MSSSHDPRTITDKENRPKTELLSYRNLYSLVAGTTARERRIGFLCQLYKRLAQGFRCSQTQFGLDKNRLTNLFEGECRVNQAKILSTDHIDERLFLWPAYSLPPRPQTAYSFFYFLSTKAASVLARSQATWDLFLGRMAKSVPYSNSRP